MRMVNYGLFSNLRIDYCGLGPFGSTPTNLMIMMFISLYYHVLIKLQIRVLPIAQRARHARRAPGSAFQAPGSENVFKKKKKVFYLFIFICVSDVDIS